MASKESRLKDRFSYLDALVSAIIDHERNLNDLISRLEKIVEKISEFVEKVQKDKEREEGENNFIFIKVNANVSSEKREKIRKSLN